MTPSQSGFLPPSVCWLSDSPISRTMVYPRECPGCGTLTPEDGFGVDRHQSSGRKSRCRACHRRDVKAYHATIRKPRRLAALEAERAAEMKVLEREHKRRLKAVHKEAVEGARRQKALLAELGSKTFPGRSCLGASGRPGGSTSAGRGGFPDRRATMK